METESEYIKVTTANMLEISRALHRGAMNYMDISEGHPNELYFLGLAQAGEAGELANQIKKLWRDKWQLSTIQKAKSEIADCLAYLLHVCDALRVTPEEVFRAKTEEVINRDESWVAEARKLLSANLKTEPQVAEEEWTVLRFAPWQLQTLKDLLRKSNPKGYPEKALADGIEGIKQGTKQ